MPTIDIANPTTWYALAAYAVISGLLSLVLAKRSQIDAWAESKPRLAGMLKLLRGLGLDPWLVVQGLSLLFRGKLPGSKKPPSVPPAASTLLISLLLVLGLGVAVAACSPRPSDGSTASAPSAHETARYVYNGAALALTVIADLEAERVEGVANPTPADVAKAEENLRRLKEAKAALAIAREWLDGKAPENAARQALIDGATLLELLAAELQASGVRIPDEALVALTLAKVFAGGSS